jgi:hypothetical protein
MKARQLAASLSLFRDSSDELYLAARSRLAVSA